LPTKFQKSGTNNNSQTIHSNSSMDIYTTR